MNAAPRRPHGLWHRVWHFIRLTLLALAVAVLAWQLWLFCLVVWYNTHNPTSTPLMREQLQRLQARDSNATLRYDWVDYDAISDALKRAVIAAEDARFVAHGGIEWQAIRHAWHYNQQAAQAGSERRRGGSTITQQVAKNLFLSSRRTYWRKGQELLLAFMMEHVMDKRRILELYLNIAEWGVGVFGAQAAARHYYQRPAAQLNAAQAARLAAQLPNPRYYDQHRNTAWLRAHSSTVRARMRLVLIP